MTEKNKNSHELEPGEKYGFGVRHVQVILMFICLSVAYIMRVNMSVAIVAMTDKSSTWENIQIFDWDKKTQDVILSSFFWGYMVMQIPAGQLAHRYGAKTLLVVAMTANGLISLIIPWAVNLGGWKVVCACRALQGLTQASMFPCMHTLVSKWIPNSERSRLSNFAFSGTPVGTIVGMPLSSILASTSWGWPWIFYVIGFIGILTGVMWFFLGADSPAKHTSITKEEKSYIENALGNVEAEKAPKTPWKSIFTSLPFLALAVAHVGCNWGFTTLLVETPSYLKNALGIDMRRSGMLSALPYIGMWIGSVLLSFISDYLVNKEIFSPTVSRKVFNSIGTWIPALGLIILGYIPPGYEIAAVSMIICIVAVSSGMNMGYMMNNIDLAPNFAGTLISITNCVANGFGILAPITVGMIVVNDNDPKEWRSVFMINAGILFVTNLFFIVFGTSRKQSWNEPIQNNDIELNGDLEKDIEEEATMLKGNKIAEE
ncbi:putative inorganic phosphate cotransporter [Arctopsyche grandis]|uniref:putative inorganic phosphate cotransporter n=1 Tax=Arctopsyche grandis TaxID=121162 RepID=UPI00406D8D6F